VKRKDDMKSADRTRQCEILGEERFLSILRGQLDKDDAQTVLDFLKECTSEE